MDMRLRKLNSGERRELRAAKYRAKLCGAVITDRIKEDQREISKLHKKIFGFSRPVDKYKALSEGKDLRGEK
jgi:hypothetical protein